MLRVYSDQNFGNLHISFNGSGQYYTTLVRNNTGLFYLVINGPGANIHTGNVIIPYVQLSPGMYSVEVYNQSGYIDPNTVRSFTDIASFISSYGLRLAASQLVNVPETVTRNIKPHDFMMHGHLTKQQESYCRCALHVGAKHTARNPNAVCAKSVGTTYRDCWRYYDFDSMPSGELRYYAEHEGVNTQGLTDDQLVQVMKQWQANKQ